MNAPAPLLIRGGTVVDPARGRLLRADVLLRHGRIAWVGKRPPQVSAREFDARGLFVAPGFIDLQVNGAPGRSFASGAHTEIEQALAHHLAAGTTGLLATLITDPPSRMAAALAALAEVDHPSLLGVHLEGPFIARARAGAHPEVHIRPPSVALLDQILGMHEGRVRLLTLAPELPGATEVMRTARAQRIELAAGHSDADYEMAMRAFSAGVRIVTHLWNAQPPFHHRAPGLVGAALDAPVRVSLICDDRHLHPATVRLVWRLKGPRRVCLISDAAAEPERSDGTLAGSPITLVEAVRNLISVTGCSLPEAVRAASLTPAELLRLDHRKGSIVAGKDADIVVLDESLVARAVVLRGEMVAPKL